MATIEFFDGLFFDGDFFDPFCYDESFFDGYFFDGGFFDAVCTLPPPISPPIIKPGGAGLRRAKARKTQQISDDYDAEYRAHIERQNAMIIKLVTQAVTTGILQ